MGTARTALSCVFRCVLVLGALSIARPALAIETGEPIEDPATRHSLSFAIPVTSGGSNARVEVYYTRVGSGDSEKRALDFMRVSGGLFAGSIFPLIPGSSYAVRFVVVDPDGAGGEYSLTTRTMALPAGPLSPNMVPVTNDSELAAALENAVPGDVIVLQNGTYMGPITIASSGTADNPIVVRGESRDGVVVSLPVQGSPTSCDGDETLAIRADNVYVETLTIDGGAWGVIVRGSTNVVVRELNIRDVTCGIHAAGGAHTGFYICDNTLSGRLDNEATGRSTWNIDGINITGQGHTICHNTLSGFGDTIDISRDTDIPSRAIYVSNNDILWGGDDGLELDSADRNVMAYQNRIANSGTGISVQPDGASEGPTYLVRNVIYNPGLEYLEGSDLNEVFLPFKLKDDAAGLFILHNTAISAGPAWQQGETVEVARVHNNLILGTSAPVAMGGFFEAEISNNGYHDVPSYGLSPGDKVLTGTIFDPADPVLASQATDWRPYRQVGPLTLAPASGAVDSGIALANINDDFGGARPDMGAIESDRPLPDYGVRGDPPLPGNCDAGTGGNGGAGAGDATGGCGCGVAGREDSGPNAGTLLPIVLAFFGFRRRSKG